MAAVRAAVFLLFGAALAGVSSAQVAAAASAPAGDASSPAAARPVVLAPVLVTGNPLGSSQIAAPASVLSGEELVRRRASTLGETLNHQPGVSSTYFGPNANRPIIRGLDGDRLRILNNAGSLLDVSSLSFDHAVAIDPLVVERIEVLRGPAALLYGGNAIGGVVNAIDNRIPKYSLSGISGSSELRLGGAERERGGAALLEAGNGSFAVHADAFGRRTSDLRVPRYTPIDAEGNALDRTRTVRNSQSRTDGGAIGGSFTGSAGYAGISADRYDSSYGVVVEDGVTIRLKRDHVALGGEARDLPGPIRTVRAHVNDTRYRHEEIEGSGEVATVFKTSGTEARVEAEHVAIGPLRGVLGVQAERFSFSALGEEAFVPRTRTRRAGLFIVEESASPVGTLSGGLRIERARVESDGDEAGATEPKFGPAGDRRFTLRSASISDVVRLSEAWSVTASLSTTARAPTYYELFANGIHVATATFERGDSTLRIERGHNVDLALLWKSGADRLRIGAFATRFRRYISLEPTGATISEVGENGEVSAFPEYAFRAVRARFSGIEVEGNRRLLERSWTLDASGKLDYTRATNRSTGEPLPRIAPLRASLALEAGSGPWLGRFELEGVSRQSRVPGYDTSTGGYTLFHIAFSHRLRIRDCDVYAFVKATNLGDKLAYSASTIETVRGLVPLPGRAVKAGLRVDF